MWYFPYNRWFLEGAKILYNEVLAISAVNEANVNWYAGRLYFRKAGHACGANKKGTI